MALNYTPLNQTPQPLNTNPLLGRLGSSLGSIGKSIGSAASYVYNGVKDAVENPATYGTQKVPQYNQQGLTPNFIQPTQNYTPAPTPANPAATGTKTSVNTTTSSPAANTYIQNQVTAGTNQPGLYNPLTGLTQNGLNPSQVSQGYSTIPGSFDPVTGKPIGSNNSQSTQGTQPYTPQPSQNTQPNTQQIDPITGLPLTPNSNLQTDQAYQNYLQAIQPNQNVIGSEQVLNDFTSQANQNINRIGAQPILSSFATGQQQVAAQNANLQEQKLQGDVSIAQQAQQQSINAGQAGLDYSQGQQQLAQQRYLGTLPTPTGYGQTSFNPATNSFGAQGGANLDPQTQATTLAQQVASGKISYTDAVAGLGYAGAAGTAFLQQALSQIPGINLNQLEGQSAASQANAQTIGSVDTATAATGYANAIQQYQQMNTASQAATQEAQTVSSILAQSGLNNSNSTDYTKAINNLAGRLGSTNVTALNTALTELQSRYSSLLAGNGQTPSSSIKQALLLLDPNSTAAQINTSIQTLQNAADILTSTQYQQALTYHNQLTGSGSTSSSNIYTF